jgi:hypothetical protein
MRYSSAEKHLPFPDKIVVFVQQLAAISSAHMSGS